MHWRRFSRGSAACYPLRRPHPLAPSPGSFLCGRAGDSVACLRAITQARAGGQRALETLWAPADHNDFVQHLARVPPRRTRLPHSGARGPGGDAVSHTRAVRLSKQSHETRESFHCRCPPTAVLFAFVRGYLPSSQGTRTHGMATFLLSGESVFSVRNGDVTLEPLTCHRARKVRVPRTAVNRLSPLARFFPVSR